MSDYTKLIEALRRCQFGHGMCAECPYYGHKGKWNGEDLSDCDDKMHLDAADAIEELQQIAAHYEQSAKDWWKEACEYKEQLLKKQKRIEELEEKQTIIDHYGQEWMTSSRDIVEAAYQHGFIDGQVGAKQQLPKHGEWVGVSPTVDTVQCSICGEQLFSAELKTPYCPNCGSKMGVQNG